MPQWICGSMPPGMTICPAASTSLAAPIAARLPGAPIAAILPPLTPISAASVAAGITAVPPETIRSNIAPSPGLSLPVARPVVIPQEIGAELIEARAADLAHDEVDLAAEDVDRLLDPGEPARHRAIEGRSAEKAELRPEAHRDHDVGAAPDAAVEHHGLAVADGALHRRQHVERGRR